VDGSELRIYHEPRMVVQVVLHMLKGFNGQMVEGDAIAV
jgi:hypothetical protein